MKMTERVQNVTNYFGPPVVYIGSPASQQISIESLPTTNLPETGGRTVTTPLTSHPLTLEQLCRFYEAVIVADQYNGVLVEMLFSTMNKGTRDATVHDCLLKYDLKIGRFSPPADGVIALPTGYRRYHDAIFPINYKGEEISITDDVFRAVTEILEDLRHPVSRIGKPGLFASY